MNILDIERLANAMNREASECRVILDHIVFRQRAEVGDYEVRFSMQGREYADCFTTEEDVSGVLERLHNRLQSEQSAL